MTPEGPERLVITIEGPLAADAIIDAHVRALATTGRGRSPSDASSAPARGTPLTIIHTGDATPVALRTAARFGITLERRAEPAAPAAPPAPREFDLANDIGAAWSDALDAIARRDARAPTAPPDPAFELPAPGFFRALERAPAEALDAAQAFAAMDALAAPTAGEATPEVRPVADPAEAVAAEAVPPAPTAPAVPTTGEASPEVLVAHSDPEPALAHADPALPWDLSLGAPEPEPVHVEAAELASMPWNLHEEQHEMLPAGRVSSLVPARPTQLAQDWGLPWPRPVVPTGGLAIADPKLWHAQERIGMVREDLDRAGAPSFGAVKPEGRAWLKRLHEFGAP